MNRNGPLSLAFHWLFIAFILAPLVVVILVSFTDKGFMAMPVLEIDGKAVVSGRVPDAAEISTLL